MGRLFKRRQGDRSYICSSVSAGRLALTCELHVRGLKVAYEAHGKALRRDDGVSGEKTAEVDDVKEVRKVLSVDLKPAYSYVSDWRIDAPAEALT